MSDLLFEGQIALVTGASRGIGAAIAMQLAKNGVKVIGTATTDDGAAKIEGAGRYGNVRRADACAAQRDVEARAVRRITVERQCARLRPG